MNKKKLGIKQKRWLLALHILCMVVWLGGTLCLLTLNIVASKAGNINELYVTNLNLNLIDESFIKFPAMGTLITGLLLAFFSNWGLTNYYWIVLKLVATMSIIAFGIFGMNRWSTEATNLITTIGWNVMQLPTYVFDRNMLLLGATISSSIMAIMVFLSVLKPWGRRKQIKEIAALANPVS